jgi:hypothetical protein
MPQLEPYWMKDYVLSRSTRENFEYVGQKTLSDQLVFLHESRLNFNDGYKFLADQIISAATNSKRFPVLCLSSNYYRCKLIKQVLDQTLGNENYFILLSNPAHNIDKNTAVWPQFLITMHQFPNFQTNQPKKYRISNLSGGVKIHRLQLWEAIKDHVSDQDIVIINKFSIENFENTFDHTKIPLKQAREWLEHWLKDLPWSNSLALVDNQDQTISHSANSWDNNHAAYNSMVNITNETLTDDDVLITEKTWKAYRSGCLVVNFGPTNVPSYLKQMGLGIWEEYDACLSYSEKIKSIKELFCRNDIADIYQSHIGMIQYNQNLVSNMDFIKSQTVDAVEKLKALL